MEIYNAKEKYFPYCRSRCFDGSIISAQDRVPVRWFVGLGSWWGGTDADLIEKQQAVVDEYNASISCIFWAIPPSMQS